MAQNIDAGRKAPTWFWVTLAAILLGAIIIYFVTRNEGRTDQQNMEESIPGAR